MLPNFYVTRVNRVCSCCVIFGERSVPTKGRHLGHAQRDAVAVTTMILKNVSFEGGNDAVQRKADISAITFHCERPSRHLLPLPSQTVQQPGPLQHDSNTASVGTIVVSFTLELTMYERRIIFQFGISTVICFRMVAYLLKASEYNTLGGKQYKLSMAHLYGTLLSGRGRGSFPRSSRCVLGKPDVSLGRCLQPSFITWFITYCFRNWRR